MNSEKSFRYTEPDWMKLTLKDDFLFYKVMREESFCRPFLETLLHIKIARIEYLREQKELKLHPTTKSIRMDIYLEGDGKIYNVEMQNAPKGNLPRRMRMYQSVIDADSLLKGAPYRDLKDSFVIFLCNFDPFGKGLPRYTFTHICHENSFSLDDGQTKIVYNINAFENEADPATAALLRYLSTGTAVTDPVKAFAEKVELFKQSHDWRKGNMKYECDLQDARKEGEAAGLLQAAANALKQGLSPETVSGFTGLPLSQLKEMQTGRNNR